MILAQLNLPTTTNSGKSTKKYLNQLEVETCKKFGGLTKYDKLPFIFKLKLAMFRMFNVKTGDGMWVENGKLFNDKLKIYQVAIQPRDKKEFITMCKKYGKLTKQLAIYVVINNKPRIINLK